MHIFDLGIPTGFVLTDHVIKFVEAARQFNAYILVRETGDASLQWVGRKGYTAKRGDLKCKTAKADPRGYKLAGLVCSPFIHPAAFKDVTRLASARKYWQQSQHLITMPSKGFTDTDWPKFCATPYLLQGDPAHKHYGALAWVESGIVNPRYVHGDYDLYAVVPARSTSQREANPGNFNQSGVARSSLSLSAQVKLGAPLVMDTGPLLFKVMQHLDRAFGYAMVMHAEQENLEHGAETEKVLAFLPTATQGRSTQLLNGRQEIERFYREELAGRTAAIRPPVSG